MIKNINIKGTENFDIENFCKNIEENFSVIESHQLSEDKASYLSSKLENSPTVMSRSAKWLVKHTNKFYSVTIEKDGIIIGFITIDIYPVDYFKKNIHERIGLRVDENYRNQKIGKYLIIKMTEKSKNEPIASYTPNNRVGHVSTQYLGFTEVIKEEITPKVIKILELGGPLDGEGYHFYFNRKLFELMQKERKKL